MTLNATEARPGPCITMSGEALAARARVAAFALAGTGAVRTCHTFPNTSMITDWSPRCWRWRIAGPPNPLACDRSDWLTSPQRLSTSVNDWRTLYGVRGHSVHAQNQGTAGLLEILHASHRCSAQRPLEGSFIISSLVAEGAWVFPPLFYRRGWRMAHLAL